MRKIRLNIWKYLLGFGILFMFSGNIATAANPENAPTKGSIVAGYLQNPELTEGIADYQAPDVEIAAEFNSVEEMRQGKEGLEAGQYIKTKNYYADCNGGGAVYLVSTSKNTTDNGGTIIDLPNELTCSLVSANKTVTPLQFGAYGDGIHDDHDALQSAFCSGNDMEFEAVALLGKTYLSNDTIWMKCDDMVIDGMGATILCDDTFGSAQTAGKECNIQIYVTGSSNVSFKNLRVMDGQTIMHRRQVLAFQAVNNISIEYCTLYIPAQPKENKDGGSCNLSFQDGWHNVSVTHCEIINESSSKVGGAVGFNDMYAHGSDHALFENNVVKYDGKDEVIAIFSHSKEGAEYFNRQSYIRNVQIRHNEFYAPRSSNWTRDVGFTIGYEDSLEIDGVVYEENYFEVDAVWAFVTFSKTATNCAVRGNVIHVQQTADSSSSLSVFKTFGNPSAVAENNIIYVSTINDMAPSSLVAGNMVFQKNKVNVIGSMKYLFEGKVIAENNEINVGQDVKKAISYQGNGLTDNKILIQGGVGSIYESYTKVMDTDILWSGNDIQIPNAVKTGPLFQFNGMKMNGYTFTLLNNTISTPSVSGNALIVGESLQDENKEEQKIILEGNTLGAFSQKTYTLRICSKDNTFLLCDNTLMKDHEVQFIGGDKAQVENQWIIHGHKLKQPIADVITGWKVEGWYKDDAYTDAWNFDVDTVNDNVTLYGKFAKIPLESFSLNKTSITGTVGEKIKLIATFLPEDTIDTKLLFVCEDSDIATVSGQGEVYLKSVGETTIQISAIENPELTVSIPVCVSKAEDNPENQPTTKPSDENSKEQSGRTNNQGMTSDGVSEHITEGQGITQNEEKETKIILGKVKSVKAKKQKVLKNAKRRIKIDWKKVKNATSYQIYISTNKGKKYKRVKTISAKKKCTYTYTGKEGKTIYIKIRAVSKKSGKTLYGSFSKVKKVKL